MHGTAPTVNRILDHPDIRAVAFVGSNGAGRHVLKRGTSHGKRIQVWKPMYDSSFFWAYLSRGQRRRLCIQAEKRKICAEAYCRW